MRAVLQRVTSAAVRVQDEVVGEITEPGLVVLLGITHADTEQDIAWLVRKVRELRIMRGETSLADLAAPALVISQFTLYGDARKGRRPSWSRAAPGPLSEPLYDAFCAALEATGTPVARGRFGADMELSLVNDGPVTLILDSPEVG